MRIAEISTPEARHLSQRTSPEHGHLAISELESLIKQVEALPLDRPVQETLPSSLRQSLTRLSQSAPFTSNAIKLRIWELGFRLWNSCVDRSNFRSLRSSPSSSSDVSSAENIACLRHVAADMLFLVGDISGVPSPFIKSAFLYHLTGLAWHDLKKFDLASFCFERAADLVSRLDLSKLLNRDERKFLLDLNLARARTEWEVSDRNLAVALLNRAKSLLFGSLDHFKSLAKQFLGFGRSILIEGKNENLSDALKLMNEALELCEKALSAVKSPEDTAELKSLRLKILRLISAVHLQKGQFESVIKCIKVLRGGGDGSGDSHSSLPVLAMRAWLGLGRYDEAEKELRSLVGNSDVPECIWVSAVEAYFEAVGTAGAETAKSVFLGLLGRCHVSAKAALKVVHRVLGDSNGCNNGSKTKATVVAQLVSDERVVALFAGEAAARERKAMQAMLWDCAADYFRVKDFETSADMFEKSMLYIPFDIENRAFRARGFRVLCLCYLGLLKLDRAREYVDEAEKLEPNVACTFLKFKIYLLKSDHDGAASQIEAMTSCLDFTPDFLTLAAHEALGCHAFSVAVASLSRFLNFFGSGGPMPTPEVVVLRTIVTVLNEDTGSETDVLKFLQRAYSQASKLGPDGFFGEGETGRREKNWFAVTSWNLGTRCGKDEKYEAAVECFKLASVFYGFMEDGEVGGSGLMVFKSLALAVSALIASENQKKATLTETEVKQAAELLDKAGKILRLNPTGNELNDEKIDSIEPGLVFLYTLNAYDIHGRLNNSEAQQLLVKTFSSTKACAPSHLLQLGCAACEGPRPNPDVAMFALNECLSASLASPSPDYLAIAIIMRKLISVASIHKGDSDDDLVYNMYKQACKVMVGLKEGEYPTVEGKWLAITAWNRASLPVRLGQVEEAKKWMNVGLELAGKIPGMETYRACMEDYVAKFERKQQIGKSEKSMTSKLKQ